MTIAWTSWIEAALFVLGISGYASEADFRFRGDIEYCNSPTLSLLPLAFVYIPLEFSVVSAFPFDFFFCTVRESRGLFEPLAVCAYVISKLLLSGLDKFEVCGAHVQ